MKLTKFVSLTAIIASAVVLGGCVANTETAHQKSTAFGLWTFEPECYTPNDGTSIKVRTEDMTGMETPSGDRLQLFWGLVSIEDY